MKVLFLCGSLEPGCDGVGDYTRRLAGELFKQGHETAAIALNDKHISETNDAKQEFDGILLPTFRLPANLSAARRFSLAKEWIEEFDPEWISLQFVAFSFHPKGLSLNLDKHLILLGNGRKWHIMFHELWVGMEQDAGLKLVWWGKLQKNLIQLLIRTLKPAVVHTQTSLYKWQLANMGIAIKYLPLFSNISVFDFEFSKSLMGDRLNKNITLVLFGGIHPGAPIEDFANEAACYARGNRILLKLIIVGRSGRELEHWATVWKSKGLSLELLGEQPSKKVSEILQSADFGISTTPVALVEKSGTVAAMREHGLPVICVRHPWKALGILDFVPPEGIIQYQIGCLKDFFKCKTKNFSRTTVTEVGKKLVDDFLSVSTN